MVVVRSFFFFVVFSIYLHFIRLFGGGSVILSNFLGNYWLGIFIFILLLLLLFFAGGGGGGGGEGCAGGVMVISIESGIRALSLNSGLVCYVHFCTHALGKMHNSIPPFPATG